MNSQNTKKPTRATLKSFVKKNADRLLINVTSRFDGMTDCCEQRHGGFSQAKAVAGHEEHTLGIQGIWLVGQSRDSISHYEKDGIVGFKVYNCCGSFIVGVAV